VLHPNIPPQYSPDLWKHARTVDEIEERIILAENIRDIDRNLIWPGVLFGEAIDGISRAADALGIPVRRPKLTETTALGAAYLAGLGAGLWQDSDLTGLWKLDREFTPKMSRDEADSLQDGWRRAVERSRGRPGRDNQ